MSTTPVTPTPAPTPTPTTTSTTSTSKLGRALGLALLGLEAYDAQNMAGSGGPSMFENPVVVQNILADFITVWNTPIA